MTDVATRWRDVRAAVDAACHAAGRAPAEVTVVAVSKHHPVEALAAALAAGVTDLGENYVQELVGKQAALAAAAPPRWHFIGRLQRNKARQVAGQVALVHAVDSVELGRELGKRVPPDAVQPILVAVNLAGEATKGGVALTDAPALVAALAEVPGVRVDGLMTMPPPTEDPATSAPYFDALRALRDRLATPARPLPHLSMGMSDDFATAIACGATIVRIGTAIFGPRPSA
ncbi:MAG: YggS family pyridoxal phosphate-dependent enzyme [Kofleriaceae bacterium]